MSLDHNSRATNNGRVSEYSKFCKEASEALDYVLILLADIFRLCAQHKIQYCQAAYDRDRKTIAHRFQHEGLVFITKTLPSLFQCTLEYVESGIPSYQDFRKKPGTRHPAFLQDLFKVIHDDTADTEKKVKTLELLFQLLVSFKKLKGPFEENILLGQLRDLKRVDRSLFDQPKDDYEVSVLNKARTLIESIFAGFNPDGNDEIELLRPRPGPGATNTPTEKAERYRPHRLYEQLEQLMPSETWHRATMYAYPLNYEQACLGCKPVLETTSYDGLPIYSQPHSRFKFVFKEFGKPRGICIEELEMQWRQQALRRYLYQKIEEHPLTKGFVNFTEQSINADLALEASRLDAPQNRQLATVDMKDASNRVSRQLVHQLFHKTTLYPYLDALSTRYIDLPKTAEWPEHTFKINMYAPMGSALCFPIMALVHYALIKAIISMHVDNIHMQDIPVWVYGDDILFDRRYIPYVFADLPRFGMKINESKSFYKGLFRESCGMNAYNGVNITPVRFRYLTNNTLSNRMLKGILETEGMLFAKGYHLTCKYMRDQVSHFVKGRIPYVTKYSKVLGFIRDPEYCATWNEFRKLRWEPEPLASPEIPWYQRHTTRLRVFIDSNDEAPPISVQENYLRKQVELLPELGEIDGKPHDDIKIVWKDVTIPDVICYPHQKQ